MPAKQESPFSNSGSKGPGDEGDAPAVTVRDGVPQTEGGVPAIKVMASAEEKIGLPNYSNVVVGPISVTRYVADGDDAHVAREVRRNLELVEEIVAEERKAVLDGLKGA